MKLSYHSSIHMLSALLFSRGDLRQVSSKVSISVRDFSCMTLGASRLWILTFPGTGQGFIYLLSFVFYVWLFLYLGFVSSASVNFSSLQCPLQRRLLFQQNFRIYSCVAQYYLTVNYLCITDNLSYFHLSSFLRDVSFF
jgi:hypothetical protein